MDPANGSSAHHQEGAPNGAGQKNSKDAPGKKREDTKPGPKKTKEKVDALSQFDLNNYASMFQILYFLVTLSRHYENIRKESIRHLSSIRAD